MPHAPKRGSIPPTGNRTVTSPPTRRAQTFEMETYNGYVRTPADAIKLFEACRLGLLPRVQRRLSEKERQSIRSGSVFVWDEREAGMRRWTDGKSWSASRVSGSFLTYREMEGKRSTGFGTTRRTTAGRSPDVGRLDEEDHDQDGEPEGYRYKTDGLMKQSFSLTTSTGNHLHLISYYSRPQPGEPELRLPSNDPLLQSITPDKAMYPDSSLHESSPPVMTRTPMPSYNSAGPQDQWGSPAWMATPFSTTPNQSPHSAYSSRPEPEIPRQPHHLSQLHRQPQYQSPHYQPSQYPSSQYPPPAPANHHPSFERLPQPVIHMANGHPSRSPRSQQLQVQAAQAVLIDPRVATAVHNSQGPSLAISASGRIPSPPRAQSITPPGMASPVIANDAGLRRASLSNILLHPAPGSSETNGANPASSNSGSSSPRATVHERSADRLALRSLDRNFCN